MARKLDVELWLELGLELDLDLEMGWSCGWSWCWGTLWSKKPSLLIVFFRCSAMLCFFIEIHIIAFGTRSTLNR